jgi:peptide/nickel transport system permease protein
VGRVILARLWALPFLIFVVTLLVFVVTQAMPGSAASALVANAPNAERLERLEHELDLDRSPVVQYVSWVGDLAQGDLGRSLLSPVSVADELWARIPVTAELALWAMLLSLLLGIPLGIVAASRPNGVTDGAARGISIASLGVPEFVVGMVLIYIFSLQLGWLPPVGYAGWSEGTREHLESLALPVFALAFSQVGLIARQTRSAVMSELGGEYVLAARAKGLSGSRVLVHHALRNAWLPIVTVVGVQVGRWLGGAVIVEVLFGLPGVGRLTVDATINQDVPMIQGAVLVLVVGVVLVNLLVDLLYGVIDPRVRQA